MPEKQHYQSDNEHHIGHGFYGPVLEGDVQCLEFSEARCRAKFKIWRWDREVRGWFLRRHSHITVRDPVIYVGAGGPGGWWRVYPTGANPSTTIKELLEIFWYREVFAREEARNGNE
jgi:hypothetical protein